MDLGSGLNLSDFQILLINDDLWKAPFLGQLFKKPAPKSA